MVPFFYDSNAALYYMGDPIAVSFGGSGGSYGSLLQVVRIPVRGNPATGLLVAYIAGTGASLDIRSVLS